MIMTHVHACMCMYVGVCMCMHLGVCVCTYAPTHLFWVCQHEIIVDRGSVHRAYIS